MPEVFIKPTPFIVDAMRQIDTLEAGMYFEKSTLFPIAEQHDQEIIGFGKDSIVIPWRGSENKVLAFAYRENISPREAKRIYYVHRILSTLFPHNFPRIYASFGKYVRWNSDMVVGTVRQRIKESNEPIIYSFDKIEEANYGLDLPLFWEIHSDNLIVDDDGGEYFVDITEPIGKNWRVEPIVEHLNEMEFEEEKLRTQAEKNLDKKT